MKNLKLRLALAACGATLLFVPAMLGQASDAQKHVAALKQSLARDKQQIRQYQWIETTVISLKGEEKARLQKQCSYGPDGTVQKVDLSEPPPEKKTRGLRGRIKETKKAELSDYMKAAVELVKSYVPPDPAQIQKVKDAGKVSVDMPGGGHGTRVNFRDYALPGDLLSVELDSTGNRLTGLAVNTYLDDPKDVVTLEVRFASLNDGTGYAADVTLAAQAKNMTVNVSNSGYQKVH